jgi:8-oxo-dGTP diphosphatase
MSKDKDRGVLPRWMPARWRTSVAVKAVICNEHGEVLTIRRSKTDPRRPLTWDLPGGTVPYGADIYRTLLREIYEETGWHATIAGIEPVTITTRFGKDEKKHGRNRRVYVVNVVCKVRLSMHGSEPKLSWEHDEWMLTSDPDRLVPLDMPERYKVPLLKVLYEEQGKRAVPEAVPLSRLDPAWGWEAYRGLDETPFLTGTEQEVCDAAREEPDGYVVSPDRVVFLWSELEGWKEED